MIKRVIKKIVTEKEYDDINDNRIINVNVKNKLSIFGLKIWERQFDEALETIDGGEYKKKEKLIGFNKK